MECFGSFRLVVLLMIVCAIIGIQAAGDTPPAKIGRFPQETATVFGEKEGLPPFEIEAVRVGADGAIYAATTNRLLRFEDSQWKEVELGEDNTPLGRWLRMLHPAGALPAWKDSAKNLGSVREMIRRGNEHFVVCDLGLVKITAAGDVRPLLQSNVRQLALSREGRIAAASADGLFLENAEGKLEYSPIPDGIGCLWGASDVRGVAYDGEGRLWFASPAGAACQPPVGRLECYTGAHGLPYNDFTCLAADPQGAIWFGTRIGAIRFDGAHWAYRQGRRWLPNDEVRSIAVTADGAAWFATGEGVGRIACQLMTLAEKAIFYEDEMEKYIRRTPFGYVSEVALEKPGDKSKIIYSDSDNDGLWTSMYGAGECFAYAATKDPKAKDRAKRAFEALRFLQKVTQDCEFSPPKGYVARTIRSVDEPDPNIGRIERDRESQKGDALWKIYEPRWPKSADGKWFWKSDTSSDELDGHYFFYPAYYDLVADTEDEKERVRKVVRDLTDHLISHGYNLVDFDGTPTRWGVYSPESLNNDPAWWEERGLKSLSMLSYLAVAEHMTGDPKYAQASRELIDKHGYRANAMRSKVYFGPGSGNQSDDEMAFMSFYNLMKYSQDETLRNMILYSFYSHWTIEQPEMNPFFNFAYAAFGLNAVYRDPWRDHDISIWDGWLEDAMATLKGFPLDRVDWGHLNSHRLDIIPLDRQNAVPPYEPMRPGRGYRVNGKVLPVEERYFHHWNSDPWALDYRGDGRSLGSGTVFLLPYYMGLYHGFIQETE